LVVKTEGGAAVSATDLGAPFPPPGGEPPRRSFFRRPDLPWVLLSLLALLVSGAFLGYPYYDAWRLVAVLSRADRAAWTEERVFDLFREKGGAGVWALARALGDSSVPLRYNAARMLGRLHDRRALPALVRALADEHPNVRLRAAWALGELGDRAAVPELRRLLERTGAEERELRLALGCALALLGERDALPLLAAAQQNPDPAFRWLATQGLLDLTDPASVGMLLPRLEDDSPEVRTIAAVALGRSSDPGTIQPLLRALERETNELAAEAMRTALEGLYEQALRRGERPPPLPPPLPLPLLSPPSPGGPGTAPP
jgi:hypothetical protein